MKLKFYFFEIIGLYMCGIFGILANDRSQIARNKFVYSGIKMLNLSQSRGKDSSGVASIIGNSIKILKRPISVNQLVKNNNFQELVKELNSLETGQQLAFIGQTRMATNGSSFEHYNNQPLIKDSILLVHNGIIVNDKHLWDYHPTLHRTTNVDTEIFLALTSFFKKEKGLDFESACLKSMKLIDGANSIACLAATEQLLYLSSSNGSLFYCSTPSGNELLFSSEKEILLEGLKIVLDSQKTKSMDDSSIKQISDKKHILFQLNQNYLIKQPLATTQYNTEGPVAINDVMPNERERKLYLNPNSIILNKNKFADKLLLKVDLQSISSLKRCTRCILPETFPFIYYDSSGECNYCKKIMPPKLLGKDRLLEHIKRKAKSSTESTCLFPISGGRDSCYGLHLVCEELNLNPVAYTYDWGMVTDLARRNISRLCGQLKIEHILVSADIKQKRDNIRKNIIAWLKRPSLGMIPLFMAGDKHFFYYANKIKEQMKLDCVLFSMNPLERTDFKVGFCNIDEGHSKEQHYNLSYLNKIKMLKYYSKEFICNPSYINSSLVDTFDAFISYYFIKRDYVSIYDYIEWNEQIVEDTLITQYEWETSNDTRSTWRIGDGTASFYNYIYYRIAGFSENDTLRSNMIRAGHMSRAEALDKAFIDNIPRFDSIKWYCDTIGLDFNATIKTINLIPPLYQFR